MKFDYIPNQILINQKAVYDNCAKIKTIYPNKNLFAVVKADAYGHGALSLIHI